ncbi:cobalt-zinc-cadmium efflux system protein [Desulfonatronum thiosulfatophilum]|uniref:Cobalt-zinc-cadmium efflux system protein n=1 Tax=Desulfonatronum thiosulfatophilum TaxID=617002 RepID=A0A1G6CJH7_9BACT|nr:cation diffusion facilitator family transporter [Desulfonatronum thiosulfatophilum]SDB32942.1 cobalt-zinc-cadmium efflux system protein [Desulfonatronum thiosulfatophilum]
MRHNHDRSTERFGKRLLICMGINIVIPFFQIIGGLAAGSVALISDAVHNIGDFMALLLAFVAHKLGRRSPSLKHTFGIRRVEIFAAVINAALLGGAAVYISIEAVKRLLAPTPVITELVMALALLGIIGNGLSAWLLHDDSRHSLNARGAFLHMVGDMLTSVAVLVSALVIRFTDMPWLDPALSLVIVAYILFNCVYLLREATRVLLNATPKGLDLRTVQAELEALEGVESIHYLHVWNISDQSVALTAHVVVPDQMISATEHLAETINKMLNSRFGIDHPVLQFETRTCGRGTLLCEMTCDEERRCREG